MSEIYTDTHAGQSKIGLTIQKIVFKISSRFPRVRTKLIKVGELPNYVKWAEDRYPEINKYRRREVLR